MGLPNKPGGLNRFVWTLGSLYYTWLHRWRSETRETNPCNNIKNKINTTAIIDNQPNLEFV